jgi:DHA1 family multidrug resistance protein-like MFS transporter
MIERLRTRSWVWLLGLFSVAGLIEAVFLSHLTAFTPLYLQHLGIGGRDVEVWTGLIATISTAVGLPFLPLWGALADRYSRQPVIIRSFVAYLLGGILAMVAGNVWVFVLGRSVMSLSLGLSGPMLTTLSERTPKDRVGMAFGIMNGAPSIGALLGPLVGGKIVDEWGFTALLGIDSALMALVILGMTFGYKDNFVPTSKGPLLGMALDSIRIIISSPRLRMLFPALFLLFAGWMLVSTYVALVVGRLYRGEPNQLASTVGLVLGAGGFATMVLSPILGAVADRVGHWRMLFIASVLLLLLLPLPALAQDLGTFTILWAALSGVASSVLALSFNVLASSTTDEVRGRVMTFSYLPVHVGFAVGPAVGSVVTQMPLGIFAIFPVAAVITAVGIGAMVVAAR